MWARPCWENRSEEATAQLPSPPPAKGAVKGPPSGLPGPRQPLGPREEGFGGLRSCVSVCFRVCVHGIGRLAYRG